MNRFGDDVRFTRLLDRAVFVARAGRVCEFAGRVVTASCLAVLAIAIGRGIGLRIPFPSGPALIATAIGIAVWRGSRRWTWPDRLGTAMAIERAHPWIGERISRAVAFIGSSQSVAVPPGDLATFDLMRESVEEAATQLETAAAGRSAHGGSAWSSLFPPRWPLAGLACIAAVVVAAVMAPTRFHPLRSTESIAEPPGDEPSSIVPKSAAAAAIRLAEAAAAEERLAAALLDRFAASPGAIRETLARRDRDWLDEIGSLQAGIAVDIGRDLSTVVSAVAQDDPRRAAELARGLVQERTARLASAAERIRGNQLAAASGLITTQVRPILATLQSWGVTAREKTGPAFDRAELARRRIVSAIEADATRAAVAVDAADATARAADRDLVPADSAGRVPGSIANAPSDRGGSAVGGGTAGAGGPAAAGGSSGPGGVAAADGSTPAWVRAREDRRGTAVLGDGLAAPPRYRAAVDDYYRRLWAAESRGQSGREAAP